MKSYIKHLFAMLLLSFSCLAFANSVTVEINPSRPVINEEFEVIFKVSTTAGRDEPYISFEPGNAEVRGRRLVGKQSSARLINGKFSTSTVYKYSYQLITDRAGTLTIKDIVVDVGGEEIKVPNKRVNITSKRSQPKMFFLAAEVNKTSAYLGEGLDLNYYLL